jgi:hypothetical protein
MKVIVIGNDASVLLQCEMPDISVLLRFAKWGLIDMEYITEIR